MLKAVIFDIDNTLYSYDSGDRVAAAAVGSYVHQKLGVAPERFNEACKKAMQLQFRDHSTSASCHSRAIRYMMAMEMLGQPLRHAHILNDLYWNSLLGVIKPYPDVKEFIEGLRSRGIRIGVGTDMTTDWQLKKLDVLGLLDLVDFVVTSEEAEAEKPAKPFFDIVLQRAGCQPEECLFIGDNLKKDVQGAMDAGMHAWWFRPDGKEAESQPIVTSVCGYKGLIEHINQLSF